MSKMVLVVDDEEDIVFILKNVLEKKGYVVKDASTGEECLEILKKEKPDLIIMDVMMPGIDGWETTRRIKTDERTKGIPVSILSVKSDPEDRRKSLEYSLADEHLSKPVDFDALLNTVELLLLRNN
ncbi:MAG: response regulator [Methanobacteriota archaeon]|nr:MAG: response regulator [Euryarchaeota archaeon]